MKASFSLILLAGGFTAAAWAGVESDSNRGGAVAMPWGLAPSAARSYVDEAMVGNLALQARTLDVEAARERLAAARAALQPRVDLIARYTRADGGRTIDFPAGDLLNGVYATLNDYLRSTGRPGSFPQLSNSSIPLLRNQEQETKLRLTQPLYRPEITRGVRARRAATAGEVASLEAFRRELRLTVLSSYYAWLQADAAVGILDSAVSVTTEALRVTRALQENGQATEDRVLRAESDDLAVRQQQAEAVRDRNSAQAFFNFLLNRPLDASIVRTSEAELRLVARPLLDAPAPTALTPGAREELRALDAAVEAALAAESAASARSGPSLDLAVEGGIQGETYHTRSGSGFVQGSLVAQLAVWDGHERRSQTQQARLARRQLELRRDETRLQLALQVRQASDDVVAAVIGLQAAERRRLAATRAFELVSQREREGLVNQLTFLDARSELTRAELNRVITGQRLFTAAAALDRAAALSPLP
ncbi:MAG: TolC family protein [Opitutaceae bacterium]